MSKFMDDYGKPLITLSISGIIYALISMLVPASQSDVVLTFLELVYVLYLVLIYINIEELKHG